MSKNSKINLLFDKKDYIKKISDDDVINIIGTKGSGKTTSTIKYIQDEGYIVIIVIGYMICQQIILKKISICLK